MSFDGFLDENIFNLNTSSQNLNQWVGDNNQFVDQAEFLNNTNNNQYCNNNNNTNNSNELKNNFNLISVPLQPLQQPQPQQQQPQQQQQQQQQPINQYQQPQFEFLPNQYNHSPPLSPQQQIPQWSPNLQLGQQLFNVNTDNNNGNNVNKSPLHQQQQQQQITSSTPTTPDSIYNQSSPPSIYGTYSPPTYPNTTTSFNSYSNSPTLSTVPIVTATPPTITTTTKTSKNVKRTTKTSTKRNSKKNQPYGNKSSPNSSSSESEEEPMSSPPQNNNNYNSNDNNNTNNTTNITMEIIDDPLNCPFPRMSTQNHAFTPPPKVMIRGLQPNEKCIILCRPEPDNAFDMDEKFSEIAVPNKRGEAMVVFHKLKIRRKKNASSVKQVRLTFFALMTGTKLLPVGSITSQDIDFFNHTNDLPNPEIIRVLPSVIFLDKKLPKIQVFSNYFKSGPTHRLNIDLVNGTRIAYSVSQDQMDIDKDQSFKVSFRAPTAQAGIYGIVARYSKDRPPESVEADELSQCTVSYIESRNDSSQSKPSHDIFVGGDNNSFNNNNNNNNNQNWSFGNAYSNIQQPGFQSSDQRYDTLYHLNQLRDTFGNTLISQSIAASDYGVFSKLRQMNPDLTVVNHYGLDSFLLSCASGNFNIFQQLVEDGSNLNSLSKLGETGLHLAIQANHQSIVECLVNDHSHLLMIADQFGSIPFQIACMMGNLTMVDCILQSVKDKTILEKMLNHRDLSNTSAFDWSIASGNRDLVERLLSLKEIEFSKFSGIEKAILLNHLEILSVLHQNGLPLPSNILSNLKDFNSSLSSSSNNNNLISTFTNLSISDNSLISSSSSSSSSSSTNDKGEQLYQTIKSRLQNSSSNLLSSDDSKLLETIRQLVNQNQSSSSDISTSSSSTMSPITTTNGEYVFEKFGDKQFARYDKTLKKNVYLSESSYNALIKVFGENPDAIPSKLLLKTVNSYTGAGQKVYEDASSIF
ncbi:hypothetical protein DLAC_05765 [Tieghemostelium lacteum]|uniref:Uncharacterized protein n=1 Tax=Tieghemostelium lacteum TaxID=361077 RepID=A0A151ZGZ4_TIELA|nr:hypothetical protein DLAC_05765 [Tieghemostelium lacteum]|eukprot:KYQ93134.1 hypothetical protein DLAC_05765 [Tieghemostelium lacteum]